MLKDTSNELVFTLADDASFVDESSKSDELIAQVLGRHITDLPIEREGNAKSLMLLGDATIGVHEVAIDRPDPHLEIKGTVAIQPGGRYVVIGSNGSGKSTLLDAFQGGRGGTDFKLDNTHAGCLLVGESKRYPSQREGICRVARLDQEELLTAVETLPVSEVVRGIKNYFLHQFPDLYANGKWMEHPEEAESNISAQNRIEEMFGKFLGLFSIEDFTTRDTPVGSLSGGERTKLSILMLLLSEPDLILADEPTNHLDLEAIALLDGLFTNYQNEGVSIVGVTHVGWAKMLLGRQGVINVSRQNGRREAHMTTTTYENYAQNPMLEHASALKADAQINWGQASYERKVGDIVFSARKGVSIENSPLEGIDLPQLVGGDFVVTSGQNGVGKTKILEYMVHSMRKEGTANVAYLPQMWPDELQEASIAQFLDWVKSESSPLSKGSADNLDLAPLPAFERKLKSLGFGGERKIGSSTKFLELSGGEQRILWLVAVSVLRDIDVIVTDEPTNHMDETLARIVLKSLCDFKGAVVTTSHDIIFLTELEKNLTANGSGTRTDLMHAVVLKDDGTSRVVVSGGEDQKTQEVYAESPSEYAHRIYTEALKKAARIRV